MRAAIGFVEQKIYMINKFCKVKIIGGRKGGFNPPVLIFDPRFGLVRWLEKIQILLQELLTEFLSEVLSETAEQRTEERDVLLFLGFDLVLLSREPLRLCMDRLVRQSAKLFE